MSSTRRYALYYAPEESSALWHSGSHWLGRCAISGRASDQLAVQGVDATHFAALTAAPRRYGLHATLKAPFRLAAGTTLGEFVGELRSWCATQLPFPMPGIRVGFVDDFVALVPSASSTRLDAIAAECVKRFDRFRAPLTDDEIARRNPQRLDRRAADLLGLWGYPFVMEFFRFHLSLTGTLPDDAPLRDLLLSAARSHFRDATDAPSTFDSICVFEEPAPGENFRLVERLEFGR